MLPRGYIWLVRMIALAALTALFFIVAKTEPGEGVWIRTYFYLAFFLALAAISNLLLLRLRQGVMKGELVGENIILSLRQGVLIALLGTVLLLLQGLRMLLWWDGLLSVAGIFLIELYFISWEED